MFTTCKKKDNAQSMFLYGNGYKIRDQKNAKKRNRYDKNVLLTKSSSISALGSSGYVLLLNNKTKKSLQ